MRKSQTTTHEAVSRAVTVFAARGGAITRIAPELVLRRWRVGPGFVNRTSQDWADERLDDLAWLLNAVDARAEEEARRAPLLPARKMPVAQQAVIDALRRCGPLTTAQLVVFAGFDGYALGAALAGLKSRGRIARAAYEPDEPWRLLSRRGGSHHHE